MFLAGINISRGGWYKGSYAKVDPSKPLTCTVHIEGPMGSTELNLPPEAADRIVALIATEIAEQSKRVAEAMTASFIEAGPALPAPIVVTE